VRYLSNFYFNKQYLKCATIQYGADRLEPKLKLSGLWPEPEIGWAWARSSTT
jgi:hypothetical protein